MLPRLREVPPLLQDLVLAAVIGTLQVGLVLNAGHGALMAGPALVEPLLLLRRTHPIVTIVCVCLADVLLFVLGAPLQAVGATMVVAAYSAGAYLPRQRAFVGIGLALVAQVVVSRLRAADISAVDVVGVCLVTATAWWMGSTLRQRREYVAALEERGRALQAARLELAERAVAYERLRLARELHDVVAHSLAIIAVQSSVAAHNAAKRPQDAVVALEAINSATRSALGELRALLAVVRDSGSDVAPLPTLSDVTALARHAEAAGVSVDLRLDGDVDAVPRAVGLSVYRIVQEAITNVVKHAPSTCATVDVRVAAGEVTIRVTNGPGASPQAPVTGSGTGLTGMRERVAAFGGDLTAGPAADGGWTVEATLPYDEGMIR